MRQTMNGGTQIRALSSVLCFISILASSFGVVAEEEKKEASTSETPYIFEKIESVELTKKEIIAHANAFIAERFVSAKSVIQLNDSDLGKIVGDVVLMKPQPGAFDAFKGIKTRLVLDAKDGRYRLQASNVEGIDGRG